MILTKKYRLIWDQNTKVLISNPYIVYTIGSKTYPGDGLSYYQTDFIEDVNNCINENNLIYNPTNNT